MNSKHGITIAIMIKDVNQPMREGDSVILGLKSTFPFIISIFSISSSLNSRSTLNNAEIAC